MPDETVESNPYASPVAEEIQLADRSEPRSAGWGWCIGYGVNLPVPVFFAVDVIGTTGLGGMVLGMAVVMTLGIVAAKRYKQLDRIALLGGLLLALSQLFPVLQLVIGAVVGGILERSGYSFHSTIMDDPPEGAELGVLGCMLAVLMVSTMLMAIALGIGTVVDLFFPKRDGLKLDA